jgi:archaellum biogenesis protein FlaJ (TadC family)
MMPEWRKKNIITISIAFPITLLVMIGICVLNIPEGFKIAGVLTTMILTVGTLIFLNEKKIKEEEKKGK